MDNDYTYINYRYIDEFDKPIERTPQTHSYSYDGFVLNRFGKNSEANHTIYSDRMIREPKYETLSKKHFATSGQMFYDRKPKEIEAFLREWFDNPELKLILIMQYCNVSSGYPIWRFDINVLREK